MRWGNSPGFESQLLRQPARVRWLRRVADNDEDEVQFLVAGRSTYPRGPMEKAQVYGTWDRGSIPCGGTYGTWPSLV